MRGFSSLILLGLGLATAWVAVSFTLPAFQIALNEFGRWNAIRSESADLTVLRDEIKKIKLGDIQKYSETLNYFLPKEYRAEEIILLLDGFVKGSGLSIGEIELNKIQVPQDARFVTPLGKVEIKLKANGSYSAFKKFLQYLETSARVFDVAQLELTREKGELAGEMTIYAYHLQ